MPATLQPGPLEGLVVIQPRVFPDGRGSFFETYKLSEYAVAGLIDVFVQDNHSVSVKGVLRGLHFQNAPHAQGKLVRVVQGAVWDVAVDLRPGSKTYGKWFGLELSAENRTQLYLPTGFAHGFVALQDDTHFLYKTTDVYAKDCERSIRWDDADIGITWPLPGGITPLVAPKDAAAPWLAQAELPPL